MRTRRRVPSEHGASELHGALLKLLSSPNLASKEWVYRQYDHMVRTNTVVLPGADAAVVRIKETRRALAIALDGNGRYCAANPRAARSWSSPKPRATSSASARNRSRLPTA